MKGRNAPEPEDVIRQVNNVIKKMEDKMVKAVDSTSNAKVNWTPTPWVPTPVNNMGWICPKCGSVHAPWVAGCFCVTVTSTPTVYRSTDI